MILSPATIDKTLARWIGSWSRMDEPADLFPHERRGVCRVCSVPWAPGDHDHTLFSVGFVCFACVCRSMELRSVSQ